MRIASAGLLLFVWAFVLVPGATEARPGPGDPAPPLELEGAIQLPEGVLLDWESLRGQVVVLDFWATWCAPCVTDLPRFNRLVGRFADRPVRFLSITDEAEPVVSKFLESATMAGWIGIDTDGSTLAAYGVPGRPYTVVVDGGGRVVLATANPRTVSAPVLEAVLAGRRVVLDPPAGVTAGAVGDDVNEAIPVFQVSITPVDIRWHVTRRGGKSAEQILPDSLVATGVTLEKALSLAYDVSRSNVEPAVILPEQLWDIVVDPGDAGDYAWRRYLQDALATTFGIEARMVSQPREVLVLTAPDGPGAGLRPGTEPRKLTTGGGRLAMQNAGIDDLARLLELSLRSRVVNETGIEGDFDCELNWDRTRPESVFEAVSEQLGLRLTTATRTLELLVVSAREDPPAAPMAAPAP